jgi:hypothetical protein
VRRWLLLFVALFVGCRADETSISGQSYTCTCELEQQGEQEALICALDAGDAIDLAVSCVQAARFCYCVEDTLTWCEIDTCIVR